MTNQTDTGALTLKGWQQENAELQEKIDMLEKIIQEQDAEIERLKDILFLERKSQEHRLSAIKNAICNLQDAVE